MLSTPAPSVSDTGKRKLAITAISPARKVPKR